ncbi:MAG: hypothetical protein ACKE51_04075 [Methylococcaceae bacterium]
MFVHLQVGRVLNKLIISCLLLLLSITAFAHTGPHGENECIVQVGQTELRLNGFQFKGSNPDRHYCRHYPHLGQTIIKVDSITADLSGMAAELQLLKRNSWVSLILNQDGAFSAIKQQPLQYFSKQVVSIDNDIQSMDLYALKVRLHEANGTITEQTFMFFIGIPFVEILIAISVLMLLSISFVFLKELRKA